MSAGHLQELTAEECWSLLAGREVGRIAWAGPDGPVIVPVNHRVADGTVWIRTTAYAALVREADESPVAFEVDSFSDAEHTGWSVLVRGTARVRYPDDGGTPPPALETWPTGPRPLWVTIEGREVTGRRLA